MGTITRHMIFCVLIVFLSYPHETGGTKPMPEPGRCLSDNDCLKGKAKCVMGECQCNEFFSVGDGKHSCDSGGVKKCSRIMEYCKFLHGMKKPKYEHSLCIKHHTGMYCKCISGYYGRAVVRGCLPVKGGHCFMSSKNCPDFSSCIASKCKCKDGYVGDGMTCKPGPPKKCSRNNQCHSQAKCQSGRCICQEKSIGNGQVCRVGVPCNKCGQHHTCIGDPLLPNVHKCSCHAGLIKDRKGKCVVPVRSCSQDNQCHSKAKCEKGRCICQGKTIGDGKICRDSKPCAKGTKCGSHAICVADPVIPDWHECRCENGFEKDKAGKCADIDECTLENAPCSKDRCNNTIGSFTCSPCQDGYTEGSEGKCVDLDECSAGKATCAGDRCTNTIGSFTCSPCQAGYTEGNDGTCVDLDECSTGKATCSKDRCTNTVGSFTCAPCQDGYTEGGEGKCVDLDECSTGKASCSKDRCTNTVGSFTCAPCQEGYKEETDGQCVAVPCSCGERGYCKLGSSECICDYGYNYSKEEAACVDFDECDNTEDACKGPGEKCVNTDGSYECECKPGYLKNGNGCVKGSEGCNCGKREECYKGKCRCKRGYKKTKKGTCARVSSLKAKGTSAQSFHTVLHLCALVTGLLGHLAFTA